MTAELGQAAPQFGLKNDDQRHREEDREAPHDPADHDQVEQRRDEGQRQENDGETSQHLGSARASKVKVAVVNDDTEQNDFKQTAPAARPEIKDLVNHGASIASLVRKARKFSATS